LLKVVGVDSLNGSPRTLVVNTTDARAAWLRAESKGIVPREVFRLRSTDAAPPKPDRKGVVYLLRCGDYHKIGKTTDPEQRYD
jgi:hypothetical protein